MSHIGDTSPAYSRYSGKPDKVMGGNVPYPAPVDFGLIRQAKVKCEDCKGNEFGACSKNPIGCQQFEPMPYDSRKEFAWYRGQQETYPMITTERRN